MKKTTKPIPAFRHQEEFGYWMDLLAARVTDIVTRNTLCGVEGAHNRIDELENVVKQILKDKAAKGERTAGR